MEFDYYTEEGHYMDNDDLISYIEWKIVELINIGYTNKEIIEFDDNKTWIKLTSLLLFAKKH